VDRIGLHAEVACLWEATARKPGNVHRYRDFDDAHYVDFLLSAAVVGRVLEAGGQGVGATVLEGVRLTRLVAPTNTNLGILLLLAPLARAAAGAGVRAGLPAVLDALTVDDAARAYEAIRLANPGGLGRAAEQDVHDEPTLPLRRVMALAADRDLVARQYADGFRAVLEEGVPALLRGLEETGCLEGAVIACHLRLLANHPDSLVVRKRGAEEAAEGSRRARHVLAAGWPGAALDDLDAWLRAEGHARNPGTTADLVAACLFVALEERSIALPPRYPWSLGPRPGWSPGGAAEGSPGRVREPGG
jgi:triphosphoribosyl-dephospho-CoA synthase